VTAGIGSERYGQKMPAARKRICPKLEGGNEMSNPASWHGTTVRKLLGCDGARIDWRLPVVFVIAQLLSNLPGMIQNLASWSMIPKELHLWLMLVPLITPVLLGAAAVLAFRSIRNVWLAAAVGASAYALIMIPVRIAFSPGFQALHIFYSWLWVYLFFVGLALAIRMISVLPLALAVGAAAAEWLNSAINIAVNVLTHPGVQLSFSSELANAGLTLVSSAIFGLAAWGGLQLVGARLESAGAQALPLTAEAAGTDAWLRKALAFHGLCRQLRAAGIGSLLFGAIAFFLGASTMGRVPLNGVLALLGILLIVEGVWVMAAPSASGIIVDGLFVAAIGLWNIGISLVEIGRHSGGSLTGRFLVFGIFQIIWGIGRIAQFRRYTDLRGFSLDPVGRARLEQEIASIRSDTVRPDVVAFKTRALSSAEGRLRLMEGFAALFLRGKVVEVLSRGEIACEEAVAKDLSIPLNASLRLGKRRLSVTISRDACERLRRWANAQSAEAPPSSNS
jgi:hypothetical protein